MSLNALKETLRSCTTQPQPPSTSSQPISQSRSNSIPLHDSNTVFLRKPPKSSLSQQLRRLNEDSFSSPPAPLLRQHNKQEKEEKKRCQRNNGREEKQEEEKEENEEVEKEVKGKFYREKNSQIQFDHTGPFEPLVLSSDGEVPIIQVPASINCRLLEHQRVGVRFLYGLYKNNHGGVLGDDMS